MSTSSDINEILQYLDSNDSDVSKHFTDVAIELLYSSRDSYLINALVDRYMQTKSPQILKLVTGINENHSAVSSLLILYFRWSSFCIPDDALIMI